MMRPKSVAWFERLIIFALAIDLLNNLLDWQGATGEQQRSIGGLIMAFLSPALGIVLWYLVTRKASNIARWLITIFVLLGVAGFAFVFASLRGEELRTFLWIAASAEGIKLIAVGCLFSASASAWFSRIKCP